MTQTLLAPSPSTIETQAPSASSELIAKRQTLVQAMVEEGLVSEAFSKSGTLDAFSLDETSGRDALRHILIGDEYGGAHHLPTIVGLGAEGREVASTIKNPANPKKPAYYRNAQKVRDDGTFRTKVVRITDEDGKVLEKDTGSVFFPNEWPTQGVLEAIIEVSKQPGKHNQDSRSFIHKGVVNGVGVIAHTDDFTGKIVAARPGRT